MSYELHLIKLIKEFIYITEDNQPTKLTFPNAHSFNTKKIKDTYFKVKYLQHSSIVIKVSEIFCRYFGGF